MSKYQAWNREVLNEQYNKLIQMYIESGNSDKAILRDISQIGEIIKGDGSAFVRCESLKSNVLADRNFLYKNRRFMHDIELFKSFAPSLKKENDIYVEERDISSSILLSVTHDFFHSLDKEIATYFDRIFKHRTSNLQLTLDHSTSYYIPSLHYGYVNSEVNSTIFDFLNLIHEYAHMVSEQIKFREDYFNYPFNELFPLLMEMIALDFIETNFFEFENDCRSVRIDRLKTNFVFAKEIILENQYINRVDVLKRQRDMVSDFADASNISKRDVKDLLTISAEEKLSYVIPTILDIELYYLFMYDKEKCLDLVKRIISLEDVNYRKYIKDAGIELNGHTKQYIKEIKKKEA